MIVYRVIDGKTKSGIFYSGLCWTAESNVLKVHPNSPKPSRHPCPEKDLVLRPKWEVITGKRTCREWYFGFESPEQMFNWFDSKEVRDEMVRLGAQVLEIKVSRANHYVKTGLFQCVFHRDHADVVAVRTFEDYDLHSMPTSFPKPIESDESWAFAVRDPELAFYENN